jgi:SAM-dependent methyltransferase
MPERAVAYDSHLRYRQDFMDVGPRFFVRTRLMLAMLHGERGRLLDVGCGDGFFLQQLAQRGFNCTGIDLSTQAVALCRERVEPLGAQVQCIAIEALQADPFDIVVCGEVLEHIAQDEDFLCQVRKRLRPGGALVLSVPLDMRLWDQADTAAGHFRRYSKVEILHKLQVAGLESERSIVWGWPLARIFHFWIRRQQSRRMGQCPGVPREHDPLLRLKPLLRLTRYLFLMDNLFNWTEWGVGIIIKARAI